jgi:hypothetical protein
MRHLRPAVMNALALGWLCSAARVDLDLIATGTFDAGTTVGNTTLAAPASDSLDAIFDPTSGAQIQLSGYSYTFTSVTMDVTWVGTVALDPWAGAGVFLASPASGGSSVFVAGVSDVTNFQGFASSYATSSDPAFLASAPTPTVFGECLESAVEPFSFPLVGGGSLSNPGVVLNLEGATAEIVAVGVAEPSTLAL